MWAIVKAFSPYLNLVVNVCVMYQSKGHQLLSNVLIIAINLIGIGI
jgi:small nuclear ribonucleoprotein (snRNP)-like protein